MKRLASLLALVLISALSGGASAGDPPNIVLIVADDLGIGDVGAFGSERIKTPRLDQIASEGIVLTNFYASANICSPSRAGILTGRYPIRSGMGWDVVTAIDTHGLPLEEITIAEMLQARGYSTALVGMWHLGNRLQFWPTRQGFDSFYGVPHSNDMPNFALYRGEQKIEQPVDQSTLTQRYTKEAVQFIKANTDRPFFLYMAHTFPHIPLFASAEFVGKSNAGLYGDAVEEIDWSTGQIVDALKKLSLYDNTLIMFTSDNRAWWEGSNGASRGAKGSTWDAGYRVGLIASWQNGIPPGQASDALSINIDLLPTIADATNSELPTDRAIDGRSLLRVTGRKPTRDKGFSPVLGTYGPLG
jgi:arylsulfatase A